MTSYLFHVVTLLTVTVLTATTPSQCPGPVELSDITGNGAIVRALDVHSNGDLAVVGQFTTIAGMVAQGVAVLRDSNWTVIPSATGLSDAYRACAWLPNGDLVVGGGFSGIAGVAARGVARWNGATWSPLGTGLNGSCFALAALPGGSLLAGGSFTMAGSISTTHVARWDGTDWHSVGGANGPVYAFDRWPGGELLVAGSFSMIGGVTAQRVARFTGSTWSALGAGVGNWGGGGSVTAAVALSNGGAVATGPFGYIYSGSSAPTPTAGVASWDGAAWRTMGSGLGTQSAGFALGQLPNGDVILGGQLSLVGGVAVSNLAAWNGVAWRPAGAATNHVVTAFGRGPNGGLLVGGRPFLGVFASACADVVPSAAAGCSGSAGPNVLTAETMPWIGREFRASATGLTGNALALAVFGLSTTAVPLAALLPEGQAGCQLLATSEIVLFAPNAAGTAATALALPGVAAAIGMTLEHQVLAGEIAVGGVTAVTSTNSLSLTLGAW